VPEELNKKSSPTVLVIEDDVEINELLGEYLALENMRYVQATTGKAGLHQALTQKPDAIILDCMLPDLDGFEIAKQLTARPDTQAIPIVMLTCMTQDADRQKGFASGVFDYMHKPFLPDDLLASVHRALAHRETVKARVPAGTFDLSAGPEAVARAVTLMLGDMFSRATLPENAAVQIREGFEWLQTTATGYRTQYPESAPLRVSYRLTDERGGTVANGSAAHAMEWTLSEERPGLLAEVFFRPLNAPTPSSGFHLGWGAFGFGGSKTSTQANATVVPQPWLQFLAKTGASSFEKDSKTSTVKFSRVLSAASGASVPIVSMDGARYPTRSRDEALASKK